jgi:hypothetical protein
MLAALLFADIPTTSNTPSGSSGTSAWVIVAVVAAVIVIGLGVLWLLRSRRRARADNDPRD